MKKLKKPKKNFNERCYFVLRKVPRGKVTTYKELAIALNSNAYRAVGNAMNRNMNPGSTSRSVPCHRVVTSNGSVGGFAYGTENKIKILKKEGIEVVNGKIDLAKYLFKFKKINYSAKK